MFIALDSKRKVWDGFGWGKEPRKYLSPASLTRALHESGIDIDKVLILPETLYSCDSSSLISAR